MGSFSIWHLAILAVIVVVLFGGGGKLSRIMGDFGKGINAFKSGVKDEETRRKEEDEARRLSEAKTIDNPRPASTPEQRLHENETAAR